MYRTLWMFTLITLWQWCAVLSINKFYYPMKYINSTAQYNSISSTFDFFPNTSITIECGYENVDTTLDYAPTRWFAGIHGGWSHRVVRDDVIIRSDLVRSVDPFRVNQSNELQSGKMTLTLNKLNESWYTPENPVVTVECLLNTINGSTVENSDQLYYNSTIQISIVEVVVIKGVRVTPSRKVNEGSNVTLTCVVSGYPKPAVTWSRVDGAYLAGSVNASVVVHGTTLILINVPGQAHATYVCSATNRVTVSPVSRYLALEVTYKPVVESRVLQYKQMVGYHLEMECSVKAANPAVTNVTWYHVETDSDNSNESKIEGNGTRLYYSNSTGTDGFPVSVLTIEVVQKVDFNRNYCCQFTNDIGDGTVCMVVHESDKPVLVGGKPPRGGDKAGSAIQTSAYMWLVQFAFWLKIFIF